MTSTLKIFKNIVKTIYKRLTKTNFKIQLYIRVVQKNRLSKCCALTPQNDSTIPKTNCVQISGYSDNI